MACALETLPRMSKAGILRYKRIKWHWFGWTHARSATSRGSLRETLLQPARFSNTLPSPMPHEHRPNYKNQPSTGTPNTQQAPRARHLYHCTMCQNENFPAYALYVTRTPRPLPTPIPQNHTRTHCSLSASQAVHWE